MTQTQTANRGLVLRGWLIVIAGAAFFLWLGILGIKILIDLFHIFTHPALALAYFHSDKFKAFAIVMGFILGVCIVLKLILLEKWQWKVLLRLTVWLFLGGSAVVIFLAVLKWAWATLVGH
jgi:hypothetical protein